MNKRILTPEEYAIHQRQYGRAATILDVGLPTPQPTPTDAGKVARKPSKHGNKRVTIGDLTFASRREAKRHKELRLLEQAGKILFLKLQVPFILVGSVILDGRKKPAIRYIADFTYYRVGNGKMIIIEDAKSPHLRKDAVYRLKKHLMMSVLGLAITET